jgi:hypothetical protein
MYSLYRDSVDYTLRLVAYALKSYKESRMCFYLRCSSIVLLALKLYEAAVGFIDDLPRLMALRTKFLH